MKINQLQVGVTYKHNELNIEIEIIEIKGGFVYYNKYSYYSKKSSNLILSEINFKRAMATGKYERLIHIVLTTPTQEVV